MGASNSHSNCCSSGERSPLSESKLPSDNSDLELERKVLKLDPRSPTIGIERTPIEVLSFHVPMREKGTTAIDDSLKNKSGEKNENNPSLSKIVDPRSPSANVARTPVQPKNNSTSETPGQGFINFSYEKSAMDEAPVHLISCDPRSPNVEFNRTPIQVKEARPKLDDPRSPSENVDRTPIVSNNRKSDSENIDPRSPLTDSTRTPISAVLGGGKNLRRTVLMSNALMASPVTGTSPNIIIGKKLSMDTNESTTSDVSVDFSTASMAANFGSPPPSLSSEDEVYLSSDNYTCDDIDDDNGLPSADLFDSPASGSAPSCDMSWDFGNLELSDKINSPSSPQQINDPFSPLSDELISSSQQEEKEKPIQFSLNDDKINEKENEDNDCENIKSSDEDVQAPVLEENLDQQKFDQELTDEPVKAESPGNQTDLNTVTSLTDVTTSEPAQETKLEDHTTPMQQQNNSIADASNQSGVVIKIMGPADKEDCVICETEKLMLNCNSKQDELDVYEEKELTKKEIDQTELKTAEMNQSLQVYSAKHLNLSTNNVVRQRTMRSLIPKRSRSSSLENRGTKSPQIVTISPNPSTNRSVVNENSNGLKKSRAWSLSDAMTAANVIAKQSKENKSIKRVPRQMSLPSSPKSQLKSSSKNIPRSPLASINNSNTRQDRGRSRLSNRASKLPRYQGTPPYTGGNKSLSVSRGSSSSIHHIGKEN